MKTCNEGNDEGYFFEVDIQYPEKLHKFRSDLQYLLESNKIVRVEKLVANLHDKQKYVTHIINLKQVLNHGVNFKKYAKIHEIQLKILAKIIH